MPKHNPNLTAFTLQLGPREKDALDFLVRSEQQNQSTIIRRCITEVHDRVTGKLPIDATRFLTRFDDLERTAANAK